LKQNNENMLSDKGVFLGFICIYLSLSQTWVKTTYIHSYIQWFLGGRNKDKNLFTEKFFRM
jgi:hypothetical protein